MTRLVLAAAIALAAAVNPIPAADDQADRVAAALAASFPRPRSAPPADADLVRKVKVALALACEMPGPRAAADVAPCGCVGACDCAPCRCAESIVGPRTMPPGEPPGPKWRADYAAAIAESASTRKPVVCLVTSPKTCAECRRLEKGPLRDPKVLAALGPFIPVRVDAAAEPAAAAALDVKIIPHLFVFGPDRKVLAEHEGGIRADELRELLDRVAPRK